MKHKRNSHKSVLGMLYLLCLTVFLSAGPADADNKTVDNEAPATDLYCGFKGSVYTCSAFAEELSILDFVVLANNTTSVAAQNYYQLNKQNHLPNKKEWRIWEIKDIAQNYSKILNQLRTILQPYLGTKFSFGAHLVEVPSLTYHSLGGFNEYIDLELALPFAGGEGLFKKLRADFPNDTDFEGLIEKNDVAGSYFMLPSFFGTVANLFSGKHEASQFYQDHKAALFLKGHGSLLTFRAYYLSLDQEAEQKRTDKENKQCQNKCVQFSVLNNYSETKVVSEPQINHPNKNFDNLFYQNKFTSDDRKVSVRLGSFPITVSRNNTAETVQCPVVQKGDYKESTGNQQYIECGPHYAHFPYDYQCTVYQLHDYINSADSGRLTVSQLYFFQLSQQKDKCLNEKKPLEIDWREPTAPINEKIGAVSTICSTADFEKYHKLIEQLARTLPFISSNVPAGLNMTTNHLPYFLNAALAAHFNRLITHCPQKAPSGPEARRFALYQEIHEKIQQRDINYGSTEIKALDLHFPIMQILDSAEYKEGRLNGLNIEGMDINKMSRLENFLAWQQYWISSHPIWKKPLCKANMALYDSAAADPATEVGSEMGYLECL